MRLVRQVDRFQLRYLKCIKTANNRKKKKVCKSSPVQSSSDIKLDCGPPKKTCSDWVLIDYEQKPSSRGLNGAMNCLFLWCQCNASLPCSVIPHWTRHFSHHMLLTPQNMFCIIWTKTASLQNSNRLCDSTVGLQWITAPIEMPSFRRRCLIFVVASISVVLCENWSPVSSDEETIRKKSWSKLQEVLVLGNVDEMTGEAIDTHEQLITRFNSNFKKMLLFPTAL